MSPRPRYVRCFLAGIIFLFATRGGSLMAADAVLNWNPSSSPNIAGYKIYYGQTSMTYGPPISVGSQTSYTVTNLAAGTHYFAVTAYTTSGVESDFSSEVSTTVSGPPVAPPGDTTKPVISAVVVSGITPSSAAITWITDELSNSQVEFGSSSNLGGSTSPDPSMVLSHIQTLNDLAADKLYYFRVNSSDASGNTGVSAILSFRSAPLADTAAPVVSAVTASQITQSGATITWTTNEPADTHIDYGITGTYGSSTTLDPTLLTAHSQVLSGLAPGTQYYYQVKSKDAVGNRTTAGSFNFVTKPIADTTPPTLSAITASAVNRSGATISWNTNEPADAQLEYGVTASYGSATPLAANLVNSHLQVLTNLSPGTIYHYRVKSKDGAGNTALSGDFVFNTGISAAALFIAGIWRIDQNFNGRWDTAKQGDNRFKFGQEGDTPIVGDWTGSGTPCIGTFRDGVWTP